MIFAMDLIFKGVVCVGLFGAALLYFAKKWQEGVDASVLEFQDRLLATGVTVKNFKSVSIF